MKKTLRLRKSLTMTSYQSRSLRDCVTEEGNFSNLKSDRVNSDDFNTTPFNKS